MWFKNRGRYRWSIAQISVGRGNKLDYNYFEKDIHIKAVADFLNQYDIKDIIETYKGKEIDGLMEFLGTAISYKDNKSDSLFDYFFREEFIVYLDYAYNIKTIEDVTTKYIIAR